MNFKYLKTIIAALVLALCSGCYDRDDDDDDNGSNIAGALIFLSIFGLDADEAGEWTSVPAVEADTSRTVLVSGALELPSSSAHDATVVPIEEVVTFAPGELTKVVDLDVCAHGQAARLQVVLSPQANGAVHAAVSAALYTGDDCAQDGAVDTQQTDLHVERDSGGSTALRLHAQQADRLVVDLTVETTKR